MSTACGFGRRFLLALRDGLIREAGGRSAPRLALGEDSACRYRTQCWPRAAASFITPVPLPYQAHPQAGEPRD